MKKERLLSLDIFRGLTIAAMILVNNPGSWSYIYTPFGHSSWHGCTPTDLIFPFFLFMVGLSISISKPKNGDERTAVIKVILKRSLCLFLIGLFLTAFPFYNLDISSIRILGVLQRIALVFMVIALAHHYLSVKKQVCLGVFLLVSYWLMMSFVPVPGFGVANLNPGTNFASWFDNLFLTGHMWSVSKTWDPEGLFSTLPAVVTGLLGMFAGVILFKSENKNEGLIKLFVLANVLIITALIWDTFFLINKSLWTSSYVLYAGGIAIHFFAFLYWLLDSKKIRGRWIFPFQVFGSNAITAYTLSGIFASVFYIIPLGDSSMSKSAYDMLAGLIQNNYMASLVYAILFVIFNYWPIYILHKKSIFIKV